MIKWIILLISSCFLYEICVFAGHSKSKYGQVNQDNHDISRTYNYHSFPPLSEYLQRLYKAYELAGSFYSGYDLQCKISLYDSTAFREKLEAFKKEHAKLGDMQHTRNIPVEYETTIRKMVTQYSNNVRGKMLFKFFFDSLQAAITRGKPTLMIYDIVAELYKFVDSTIYMTDFIVQWSRRMQLVLLSKASKMFGTACNPLNDDSFEKCMSKMENLRITLSNQLKHSSSNDNFLNSKKEETLYILEDRIRLFSHIHLLKIKGDEYLDSFRRIFSALSSLDMANADHIQVLIDKATLDIRKVINENNKAESIVSVSDDAFASAENIIMALRLYRILVPLVSSNDEFMKVLETIRMKRNQKDIRQSIDHLTNVVVSNIDNYQEVVSDLIIAETPASKTSSTRFKVDVFDKIYLLTTRDAEGKWKIHEGTYDINNIWTDVISPQLESFSKTLETKVNSVLKPYKPTDKEQEEISTSSAELSPVNMNIIRYEEITKEVVNPSNDDHAKLEEKKFLQERRILAIHNGKREKKKKLLFDVYKNDYCFKLKSLSQSSRFAYSNPGFFLQSTENFRGELTEKYIPRKSMIIDKRDFKTLCQITISGAASTRWEQVQRLVQNLGGEMTPTTGSIDQIHIPTKWSYKTTVHKPHGSKLEGNVSKGLNVLFRKWGIQIGRFMPILN